MKTKLALIIAATLASGSALADIPDNKAVVNLNASSNNKAIIVDNGGSNYGISQNGNDYVAIVGGYGINVYVTQN